jgi:hypothetical protein
MSSSSAHMADVSDLLLFGPVDTIQNSSPFQGEIAIAVYSSDSTKCYGHTNDDGQATQKRPSNIGQNNGLPRSPCVCLLAASSKGEQIYGGP